MTIAWLVVDLGGVAAHHHPRKRLAALSEATGLLSEEINQRRFRSGLDHAAELGSFTPTMIVEEIVNRLEHRLDQEQLVEALARISSIF